MPDLSERERYVSDMSLSLLRLPILLGGAGLTALFVAVLLSVLFAVGWYWVIFMPLLCAAGVGGLLHVLVGAARCRNHWFAGAVGVIAKPYTMSGLISALRYLHEGVRRPPPASKLPVGFTLFSAFASAWGV